MSHVHFIGGEKGGVGKSFVARLVCQWSIDRGKPFAAIDADPSHGSLARSYGEFTQHIDLEQVASADQIVDRALGAERRVIVDLPAQSSRLLQRWLDGGDVLALAREVGVRVTLWHVTDGGYDSVKALGQLLERFGDAVPYVVVKNWGRSRGFEAFDASEARRRLEALGGRVLDLGELEPTTAYAIDRAGTSFWAAAETEQGAAVLNPMDRRRTRIWLQRSYAALDALGEALD